MNKQTITFTASEQTLTKTGGIEHYASNIVSYIEASFTLGDNWTGYDSIRAVWESGYARIATVLDANNKCIVPAEVLTYKSKVNVNLVGSIVENTVLTDRLTTYPILALTVDADARVDSSETTPVTASQFEQFVDVVRDEASAIQNYTYDSEAWAVGQRAGVDVPSTDETYQNNAKYYADQGATLQQEVSDLKSEINIFGTEYALPVFYRETISGTRYAEVQCNIPAGKYTIDIGNITSADTDATKSRVIMYSGDTSVFDINFDRNQHIQLDHIFTSNVTKMYLYASTSGGGSAGDAFTFSRFAVLDNALKKELVSVDISEDVLELPIAYYDGYYDSGGAVKPASTTYKEKYTERIPCYVGLKLRFKEVLTSVGDMWVAVGEWDANGNFTRQSLMAASDIEYDYIYEPSASVAFASFTFRSIADTTKYAVSLASDLQTYLNNRGHSSSANKVTNNFCKHTIKGINHRGFNPDAPENTMPAFKLSVNNGFKFLETDVRFTSDNIPVLLHDATVDRTSNGTGAIADMTYSQARALDFGSWKSSTYAGTKIPSLEEFIVFCRNVGAYPYLEISSGLLTREKVQSLIDIVDKYGMLRSVTWISFYYENLQTVVSIDNGARVGLLPTAGAFSETDAEHADSLKTGHNDVFIDIYYPDVASAVSICQSHSLPIEAWTINSQSVMTSLDDYVSGATSDYLDFESIIAERDLA